jgi:HlyD family secretion protein
MRKYIALMVLIVIVGGVFALGSMRRGADDKPIIHVADEVPLSVNVARPNRQDIIRLVQAPGDVEATLEVEISSEIVSKIVELPVEEGTIVKKGDLLCRLREDMLRAEVQSGEARVARLAASIVDGEADLEKADYDYRRQLRLTEVNASSDKERQDYITILKKCRAVCNMRTQEAIEAQAYLKRVKDDLERTVIRSPIDGIVSRLDAKIGEVVITGTMNNPGTVIMTVSDLSRMQVRARVDEVDVPLVEAGQKARIYLQSDQDKPVAAKVVRVASKSVKQVGRDVVNFETLLEVLSKDSHILPGMTANVEIEVAHKDKAITIPVESIVHRMRKELPEDLLKEYDAKQSGVDEAERTKAGQYLKAVYVMDNEVARVRLIEPGIADTRRVELKTGLGINDVVITGPYRSLDQLKDGRKIKVSDEDKKKLAQAPVEEKPPSTGKDEKEKDEKTAVAGRGG